jgi:hypothetical protein
VFPTSAGSGQATTHYFEHDYCIGGCGASASTPALTDGGVFRDTDASQRHAVVFDLSGRPTMSDLPSPFTAKMARMTQAP